MKLLSHDALTLVSGGGNLYCTYQIATEDLSDECVNAIIQFADNNKSQILSEHKAIERFISACTERELMLVGERGEEALLLNVSYR